MTVRSEMPRTKPNEEEGYPEGVIVIFFCEKKGIDTKFGFHKQQVKIS